MSQPVPPPLPILPPRKRPQTPPPSCLVCTVTTDDLIQACRKCHSFYCRECLVDRFDSSLADPTMFPAACCALIQLHTVLPDYPADKANQYREKFVDWLAPSKFYCPSPTCSALIPQRMIPKYHPPPHVPSLQHHLLEIVNKMLDCQHSQFFQGENDITKFPSYKNQTPNPISLEDIAQKATNHIYETTAQLTADMALLMTNTRMVTTPKSTFSHAAENLFMDYSNHVAKLVDRLVKNTQEQDKPSNDLFACPKCKIAICNKCKQTVHPERVCDTTALDHEESLLVLYGMKRCPRCREGIKKMHGCRHMECRCGAHFCWKCLKSVEDCEAPCEEDVNDEEGEGEGEGEDLDAGGERRWADAGLDFGEEPLNPSIVQVWSCSHTWAAVGSVAHMECNRCFRRLDGVEAIAWECARCTLLCCAECK